MREAYEVLVPIAGQLVVLVGRLDVHTVSAVRDKLHAAVDAGSGRLVVDMSDLQLVDATGLGVLVGTQRRAEQAGRQVLLRGTPPRLRRLLRATRLERVLPTEPELTEGPPRPGAATAGAAVRVGGAAAAAAARVGGAASTGRSERAGRPARAPRISAPEPASAA
ncbi:MAG: STAS domain-containing protein [Micromonosporaceae bacterium]